MHLGFLSQDIIYGRRRTRQPQLPVWTNLSILYGLLEFGNRSAAPRRRMLQLTNLSLASIASSGRMAKMKGHVLKPKFLIEVSSWVKKDTRAAVMLAQQSHFS